MVYKFGAGIHKGINSENQQLTDELQQLLENLKSLRNTLLLKTLFSGEDLLASNKQV